MKTLDKVLTTQSYKDGFPVRGENGYGGEQDGSWVMIAPFRVKNRESAKKIKIPDESKLHWANYTPKDGWTGVLGIWSDRVEGEETFAGCSLDFY